jgi:hypothetical protein
MASHQHNCLCTVCVVDALTADMIADKLYGPLPPFETRRIWRDDRQRASFVDNMVKLPFERFDQQIADDDSALWRLTFGGDPDLFTDICKARTVQRRKRAA